MLLYWHYTNLRESSILTLPSESLLQKYKNCVKQKPGLNHKLIKWMTDKATRFEMESQDKKMRMQLMQKFGIIFHFSAKLCW